MKEVVHGLLTMANPQAGLINLVEYAQKDPLTGNMTHNSAKACMVQYMRTPMMPNPVINIAGPPLAKAPPLPMNSPLPIEPS